MDFAVSPKGLPRNDCRLPAIEQLHSEERNQENCIKPPLPVLGEGVSSYYCAACEELTAHFRPIFVTWSGVNATSLSEVGRSR